MRTGKRLPERHTQIFIQFKGVPHSIFASRGATVQPNKLVIRLQPEETIRLLMMAKQPGSTATASACASAARPRARQRLRRISPADRL
jgi:glucose-6-phosphate 1-dehydrogenase